MSSYLQFLADAGMSVAVMDERGMRRIAPSHEKVRTAARHFAMEHTSFGASPDVLREQHISARVNRMSEEELGSYLANFSVADRRLAVAYLMHGGFEEA